MLTVKQKFFDQIKVKVKTGILDIENKTEIENHELFSSSVESEIEELAMTSTIKIIDLGFAKKFDDKDPKSFCGNPESAPPELFLGHKKSDIQFNYKFDIWGIGAVAFKLFFNEPAFLGDDEDALIINQKNSNYNIPLSFDVSIELIDFINNLLAYNPYQRIEWIEIINHQFLCNDAKSFLTVHWETNQTINENNKSLTIVEVLDKLSSNKEISFKNLIKKIKYKKFTVPTFINHSKSLLVENYFDLLYKKLKND